MNCPSSTVSRWRSKLTRVTLGERGIYCILQLWYMLSDYSHICSVTTATCSMTTRRRLSWMEEAPRCTSRSEGLSQSRAWGHAHTGFSDGVRFVLQTKAQDERKEEDQRIKTEGASITSILEAVSCSESQSRVCASVEAASWNAAVVSRAVCLPSAACLVYDSVSFIHAHYCPRRQ